MQGSVVFKADGDDTQIEVIFTTCMAEMINEVKRITCHVEKVETWGQQREPQRGATIGRHRDVWVEGSGYPNGIYLGQNYVLICVIERTGL